MMRSGGGTKKLARQMSVKSRLINALNKTIDDEDFDIPRSRWVYKNTRRRCPSPPVIWQTKVTSYYILVTVFDSLKGEVFLYSKFRLVGRNALTEYK
jgi:hypothetical protein